MSVIMRNQVAVEYELQNDPRYRRWLGGIARHGQRELDQKVPRWVTVGRRGKTVSGVRIRDGKLEAFFGLQSSFWAIPEFGTLYQEPEAPIRTAATLTLWLYRGTYENGDSNG
jgi:hypothetical protein